MVYKLVNLKTGEMLTENYEPQYMGGPWGAGLAAGELAWFPVPENERPEECLFQDGKLVVDQTRKSARVTREQAKAALIARLKAAEVPETVNNSNQLRHILADILELLKMDL